MQAAAVPTSQSVGRRIHAVPLLVIAMACLRFCHVNLLWADEDYHLAAAINMLHARIPYRDFWYDKPPLCAAYYLLNAGFPGWPLRLLDAAYVAIACWLAYKLARAWWGEAEGCAAALFLAFFTTFYLPSTVIPFAADALMIAPHLAAIYCAYKGRAIWAGLWAGIAFLFNTKGVFVLAVCLVWLVSDAGWVLAGFAIPVIAGLLAAFATGAWAGYWEQVWHWGFIYAAGSPVTNPVVLGLKRTIDWLGFQAALAAGAIFAFIRMTRMDRWKLGVWLALSFVAVCLGTRFAPHYYLQILPPLAIVAARGVVLAWRWRGRATALVLAALLLVPFIRFGPRYFTLALDDIEERQPQWSDIVLDVDSQRTAEEIRSMARPGDTLFVWGYRPDMYVYTRMVSDSRFWDSQPLTGVPADRHLRANTPIYSAPAALNRIQLARSHPTFIVDGLGLLNPKLAPGVYPELRPWLADYRLVGRTKLSLIYRRQD